MSTASEGLWMWDAIDSSYFVFQGSICMALGDMLGSAMVWQVIQQSVEIALV